MVVTVPMRVKGRVPTGVLLGNGSGVWQQDSSRTVPHTQRPAVHHAVFLFRVTGTQLFGASIIFQIYPTQCLRATALMEVNELPNI